MNEDNRQTAALPGADADQATPGSDSLVWRSIFGGDSAFVLVEEVETMGISIG